MIEKETIKDIVEGWLATADSDSLKGEKGYFLVDVLFTPNDRIVVEIDHADGVWIEDCADLSRYLQERLGEEAGDYDIEVGSAGIGQPFKVARQYHNHVGKEVEVLTEDGKKVRGILKAVNAPEFVVTVREKQVVEGKKRPSLVDVDKTFDISKVKYTKYLISFK